MTTTQQQNSDKFYVRKVDFVVLFPMAGFPGDYDTTIDKGEEERRTKEAIEDVELNVDGGD